VSPIQSFLRQTSADLAKSPFAATATALGAGFVVGVAIAALISPSGALVVVAAVEGHGDFADQGRSTFQHWEWRSQRVGWFLLISVVVAGLAGLLGDGLLSSRRLSARDGAFEVRFDRFLHRSDPTVVELRIADTAKNKPITVHVDAAFLQQVRILRITPEPESEIAGPAGISFLFASTGTGDSAEVAFHIEPDEWGSLQGDFTLNDGSQVHVTQFVYP
jgi:hypothetical protein